MCERRTRKITKGGHAARMREARRLHRLATTPAIALALVGHADFTPGPNPPGVDKNAQCKVILELALKTISLMQKNSLIQQKLIDLRKETSDFVASVMNNPENKKRYLEHMNGYGTTQTAHVQPQQSIFINNMPLKLEPNV